MPTVYPSSRYPTKEEPTIPGSDIAAPCDRDRDLAVRLTALLFLFAALCGSVGCASIRVTNPQRTATEQFLLSGAAAKAVGQLTFDPLQGRTVFVDTSYFAAAEQEFVLGELRARLLLSGVNLVESRDRADVVMEVRSGGVGIDRSDFLVGLPSLVLSADESNANLNIPFVLPEIAFLKNMEQWGIASVAFVAYWRDSGEVVASSGPYVGWTTRDDWWIFGFGPKTAGNIPPIDTPDPAELDRPEQYHDSAPEPPGGSPSTESPSNPDHADSAVTGAEGG